MNPTSMILKQETHIFSGVLFEMYKARHFKLDVQVLHEILHFINTPIHKMLLTCDLHAR